jgi:hyperosmotically inducible periplasmic protein
MSNTLKSTWIIMATLTLGLAACANTGEKTGSYVDDSVITTKIKTEMTASKEISARNITVNSTRGVVTLTGTAATTQESNKAGDIARSVAGVTAVKNEIRVQPEKVGAYVDDAWITTKVKTEMTASKDVSARNISVNTSKGVVTLTGTAATATESTKAAAIAIAVEGVSSVNNEIRIQ